MAPTGDEARELLTVLVATSAINADGSEYACGIHAGIAIALAVVTDGVDSEATSVDPNALIERGQAIFSAFAESMLVEYLEEKYAMDAAVEG